MRNYDKAKKFTKYLYPSMSLSIGIIGLPNVGKSTLFNALTKKKVEASNYPFCTIDPNVGVVKVPDDRLEKIAVICRPKTILPTTIEFIDIAGLVRGAHQGEGLGNQFLSHIRECDAICEVVRQFTDSNVAHINGKIDPSLDQKIISDELMMADWQTVDKKLAKVSKEAKSGDQDSIKTKRTLQKIKEALENNQTPRGAGLNKEEKLIIKNLNLLSAKPIIYVLNIDDRPRPQDINKINRKNINWPGKIITLNAKLEAEIADLDENEREEYIQGLGLRQDGLDKLIKTSYKLLNLLTFFTVQNDILQAWTVSQGAKITEAAGRVHTDMAKGFIRAEVINWQKFIEAGGEQPARENGLIRTEGRDYIVWDGDICRFLFKN